MDASHKEYQRYNTVAIILHWVMAIGFFLMLGSGVAMVYLDIEQGLKFNLYQWHKAGGALLLMAFIVRILWRVASSIRKQIPALPKAFTNIEIIAAKLGHLALYGFMILLPVSGWVMVSASVYGLPTLVFNWFEWPHIPGIQGNEMIQGLARDAHFYLAIVFGLTIAAHIGAVIKHAVKDNENLMHRVWWTNGFKRTSGEEK